MNAQPTGENLQLLLAIVAAFAGAVAAVWKLVVPIVTRLAERHLTFVDALEKAHLKILDNQAAHELADEKRHNALMTKSDENAARNRHDARDSIQSGTAAAILEVKEAKDYLCERMDLIVDHIDRGKE